MRKTISFIATVLIGFWLYPLLFVPLMAKFAPAAMTQWIQTYAKYLQFWGL